jgi:hypothetical protein
MHEHTAGHFAACQYILATEHQIKSAVLVPPDECCELLVPQRQAAHSCVVLHRLQAGAKLHQRHAQPLQLLLQLTPASASNIITAPGLAVKACCEHKATCRDCSTHGNKAQLGPAESRSHLPGKPSVVLPPRLPNTDRSEVRAASCFPLPPATASGGPRCCGNCIRQGQLSR